MKKDEEIRFKANLYDVLKLSNEENSRWLKPLLTSEDGQPTLLHISLAVVVGVGGQEDLQRLLENKAFISLANCSWQKQKRYGRPLDDRASIVFIWLAIGMPVEKVMENEIKIELALTTDTHVITVREKAIERAKKRVKRAIDRVQESGIQVIQVKNISHEMRNFLRKFLLKEQTTAGKGLKGKIEAE